jgi:hypothetical protein
LTDEQLYRNRKFPLFASRIMRGRVRVFARTVGEGVELQDVTVHTLEDMFVTNALRRGAHKLHAASAGSVVDAACGDSGVACPTGTACCGKTCAAVSAAAGYCMCFPVGFYVGDVHLHASGVCQLAVEEVVLTVKPTSPPGGGVARDEL